MMTTRSGLRIYINTLSTPPLEGKRTFYTRRGNGPVYCWRYEEGLGAWRFVRMHTSDFSPQELHLASWKSVPEALQTQMSDHYLE